MDGDKHGEVRMRTSISFYFWYKDNKHWSKGRAGLVASLNAAAKSDWAHESDVLLAWHQTSI